MQNMPDIGLIDNVSDLRTGSGKKMLVFSPVGDLAQLEGFCSHVKALGLDKEADFLFIYRQGLRAPRLPFSAIHSFEKYPLGTSGCFFAGQYLSYLLGYDILVVADLDAILGSKKDLEGMVALAEKSGCAVVMPSKDPSEKQASKSYFVINQWGVFPRSVFEEAGFALPYTCKGGEDFEFSARLKSKGKIIIFEGSYISHPKTGLNIYHKMANAKKYYPYLAGLMKAYLFGSSYSKAMHARYLAWYAYYSFFSDIFSDSRLKAVLQRPFDLEAASQENESAHPLFSLEKIGNASANFGKKQRVLSAFLPLFSLMVFGKADFPEERVLLSIPRPALFARVLLAVFLLPIRLAQAIFAADAGLKTAKSFTFPIKPANAATAVRLYIDYITK